jgi:hypothetical protein
MVGNNGKSLYNGNCFRCPWQQKQNQQQQQQNYVIPQDNNKEVRLQKWVSEHYS